ncbi:hypothetical protein C2G38_2198023 [Gigaspora rosea]|uniref:U1-type domain-containing protein n=1 Tax=Gigaspora rosea TaxID=44941 RepID=A0A397UTB1_9GLOM|nr:hypothetical protein C2G38_2198023 [Gigaspora rosea]
MTVDPSSDRLSRQKSNTLTVRADNGLLFCNYCDLSVEWKHKSTVDAHCTSKKHLAQQKLYESKEKNKNQQTLQASLTGAESKKKVIFDLIEAFTSADIP